MRVVVTGATGNVGTAVVRALRNEAAIDQIVAVARRAPAGALGDRVRFVAADVSSGDFETIFHGADAVVHLAWLIQPGRDETLTSRVNVEGSRRVFRAVVAAEVGALVYASSVGVYSPGPKDRRVDESWPTDGIASSLYSRQKAQVERMLDLLAIEQPGLRIVRLRPGLIFQRSAATEIRRLFAGPLLPRAMLRSALAPVFPGSRGFVFKRSTPMMSATPTVERSPPTRRVRSTSPPNPRSVRPSWPACCTPGRFPSPPPSCAAPRRPHTS